MGLLVVVFVDWGMDGEMEGAGLGLCVGVCVLSGLHWVAGVDPGADVRANGVGLGLGACLDVCLGMGVSVRVYTDLYVEEVGGVDANVGECLIPDMCLGVGGVKASEGGEGVNADLVGGTGTWAGVGWDGGVDVSCLYVGVGMCEGGGVGC
eukprot:2003280-Pleurochrysis_carterae.AAC.3